MQNGRERVVVFEHLDERELPVREATPMVEIAAWRGCGAERGEYEELRMRTPIIIVTRSRF